MFAVGWGLFVRFNGLGSRPLAEDEYFSITSVQYILHKGVPEFPTGGYYVRGLPLQYLQAASVRLFGDNEFAHRLPAALFGVLTLVLTFYYARIFLPWLLALACVAMLAVSGWEIEFSRFSRMYAAFQCITLAFFLAYYYAYFGGRTKLRYLPHALVLVAVLCHELAVFLLPFLFLPLFIDPNALPGATPPRNRPLFAVISLLTMLAGLALWQVDSRLRNFHVAQSLPDGFHPLPSESLGPLAAFTILPISGNMLGFFLLIIVLAGCFLFFRARSEPESVNGFTKRRAVDVGLLLLLLSTVLHLFALSVCIGIVLLVRYQLYRNLWRNSGRLALLALSGLTACAWTFYAIYDQSWREQMVARSLPRALRILFFGWPDLYAPTIWPWIHSLPLLTVIFLAALAWHLANQMRGSLTSILGHPMLIILAVFGSIAVIDPIMQPVAKSTRYFYHIYPFMILLIVMACYEAVRYAAGRVVDPKGQVLISGFVVMGLFAVSEDFNLRQLVHINSPEVTFRSGEFKRYKEHWFWRFDDRSPADFLNSHRNEVDALVVSIHARALPYYLDPGVSFANYCSRGGKDAETDSRELGWIRRYDAWRYEEIARSKGKLELWSGRPLLGTEQELRAYTKRIHSLYFVRLAAPGDHDFEVADVWPDRLVSCDRVFLSSDGRTEVVKILLN